VNPVDVAAVALMVLFALVVAAGMVLWGLAIHWRRARAEDASARTLPYLGPHRPARLSYSDPCALRASCRARNDLPHLTTPRFAPSQLAPRRTVGRWRAPRHGHNRSRWRPPAED